MSVIRGKLFTNREIVPSGKTVGEWPFTQNDSGNWVKRDSQEEFESKSLVDALKLVESEPPAIPRPEILVITPSQNIPTFSQKT